MPDITSVISTLDERQPYIALKQAKKSSELACDNTSIAGSMSQRACVYSGARVALNPVTDAIHLVHGPIGCASYTWDIRGSLSSDKETFRTSFSTDMKELDVVFGGEKKLSKSIEELAKLYNPPVIFVYSTCIVGIIGDDLLAVCKEASEKVGIPVLPVQSEEFKGTKSDGYKAACNALMQLIGTKEPEITSEYRINILGDYNVAGDVWLVKPLFEKMGIQVITSMTGDATADSISKAHGAQLNLVQCSGSMTYLAKWMDKEYGIPFRKVSYFGIEDIAIALKTVAEFFDSEEMKKIAEGIIEQETKRIMPEIETIRNKLRGKTAAIYMGGAAKALTLIKGFRELGMEVVIIGTQTGKRDDYRQISYQVKDGTVIVDDANPLELADLIVKQKADLMVAGVKERFLAYKLGVAFCDFNHDRVIEFEGYDGFLNFARELDSSISSPVWKVYGSKLKPAVDASIRTKNDSGLKPQHKTKPEEMKKERDNMHDVNATALQESVA
ncbi:nitrogenase iron-molybdenum cofactor biosynthesis protein NifE [Methanolobus halotolerans]|uniref:Nitrogenase iron-molybdenum cofactor biosynthesis protein NifE n=1 Tax=Methanolobus halotolerans TaxID=2052935 RepID=A0A4E0PWJ3_9EURY|nr:nitrogenase iron-molybdenum cofactor biosynthesis protein NifE [Methanolobus halotolerans]TGC09751.1 nitrogenase iron-molybdenum cofactor biosynthesis protein NifE [Methanolobus halotolerans]